MFHRRMMVAVAAGVMALVGGGATAAAAAPPSHASNMGVCSSYLAQLDVPGAGNIRASVNHVIKAVGPLLDPPLSSPGDLYKVRAHQHVNADPVQECTPRQLPGGGTG
jgi:hypothetical protein